MLVVCLLLAMPVYAETPDDEVSSPIDTETDADVEVVPDAEDATGDAQAETENKPTASLPTYMVYYKQYGEESRPQEVIELNADGVSGVQNTDASTTTKEDVLGVVVSEDNAWVEWTFEVAEAGLYNVTPTYYPLVDGGRTITLKLTIDGVSPFAEAQTFSLPRIWKDESEIQQDTLGNDIRPSQIENPHWVTRSFVNELGMYDDPYFIYFEEGTHTLRMERVREAMAVSKVVLSTPEKLPTYEEYVAQHSDAAKPTGEAIKQEAERPLEKTDATLYALTDHQDAATTPTHPTNMLLNIIGGTNWSTTGQTITWETPIKEAGWYKLVFRARQNSNQGLVSYRSLYINDEIPFEEAENIPFSYNPDWGMHVLGGKESPKYVYLEPGDKVSLSVSAGEMSDVLREIQNSVLRLSEIYRKIIVITGTAPDIYQDYYLEDEIPGLKDMFLEQQEALLNIANSILAVTGETGSQTSNLFQSAERLGVYAGKSYEITSDLGAYKTIIESLSSLLLTFGQQPIELDCFYYVPVDTEIPSGKAGAWTTFVYSLKKFLGSFFNEYQTKGAEGTVEAWVSTGRDQMQIVSSMVTDFAAETGIRLHLSLVNTGDTLISATMAGKGPDIALMISDTEVINLSMRGALVDLQTEYGVFDKMGDHFTEAAWKRFRYYNGKTHGIYAIPETQAWPMLFYRTDIFEELDLTPPETWDEYYEMLRTLQGQNLNVGMSESGSSGTGTSTSIDIFQSLLFQKGGTYYNEDLTATRFDTPEAYEAFEQWSEFYSKYGVERSSDFFNRFRTGDHPIGMSGYTTYNQLMAAAPELRGLWKMTVIPGIRQEDGTINHASASGGSGCMLLTAAKKRGVADNAYKFLSWWTDTEQQVRYGRELEATMGVAARYAPADTAALKRMGWSAEELALLEDQMAETQNVFAIPGDYLLARSLTNALRATLDQNMEPRRTLAQYNRDINAEITRKRKEFGLDK